MKNLTLQDFDGRAGTTYQVDAADGVVPLTLEQVETLRGGVREDAFRLLFLGPAEPVLPQAIYPLRQDEETAEIFIVPIGRTASGVEYEAIFY
jgi:hypothetical protein